MKCPLDGNERGHYCCVTACMYNDSDQKCAYTRIQTMQENKDDQGIANFYKIPVIEVKAKAKLIKAALTGSRFFEFITSRSVEDGRESDFKRVYLSEVSFLTWNKTSCEWEEVLEALKTMHANL